MSLQVGGLPGAQEWFVVCEDCEDSSIDVTDEVSYGEFNRKKFSDVGGVFLLLWLQGLAPESKGNPLAIDQLVQGSSQMKFGGIS